MYSVECFAIILIILVIIIVFFRVHKPGYALASLPLCILPFAQLLNKVVFKEVTSGNIAVIIGVIIGALIVACILTGLLSGNIQNKKARASYLSVAGLFQLVLCLVLISKIIKIII